MARMMVNRMFEDNAKAVELLDDEDLLREAMDDAFAAIMMMPQFRELYTCTCTCNAAEEQAIEAIAASLLNENMKTDVAGGTAGPSPSVEQQMHASKRQKKKGRRQRGSGASGSK